MPEAWLRGPVEGVPAPLMPAAHALIDAREELEAAATGWDRAVLWLRPGGAASLGFHLRHVAGSLDRLLTYARGEALTREQLEAARSEAEPGDPPASLETLLAGLEQAVESALAVYRSTDPRTLPDERRVGRAGLPSTVQGLLFHAAEHARRHAGQAIATAKILRGLGPAATGAWPADAVSGARRGHEATAATVAGTELLDPRDGLLFRVAGPRDREALVRMRSALWPDATAEEVDDVLARPADRYVVLVAERAGTGVCAFAEVGTRPYAEGCLTSPVAYLEGVWTDPGVRRAGIASGLVQLAERWARRLGLTELASDAQLENHDSHAFHRAAGFEEAERSICYVKRIGPHPE